MVRLGSAVNCARIPSKSPSLARIVRVKGDGERAHSELCPATAPWPSGGPASTWCAACSATA
eukprot:15281185-Heterocapsa_arctica.AAC.1